MRSEVRRILDEIDTVLARGDNNAADLWAILTALRGPDRENKEIFGFKTITTSSIRAEAFPKLHEFVVENIGGYLWWGMPGNPTAVRFPGMPMRGHEPFTAVTEKQLEGADGHFIEHYHLAVEAIQATDPPDVFRAAQKLDPPSAAPFNPDDNTREDL